MCVCMSPQHAGCPALHPCRQVVVLRSGLGTLAHSLAQPGVKVRMRGAASPLALLLPALVQSAQWA